MLGADWFFLFWLDLTCSDLFLLRFITISHGGGWHWRTISWDFMGWPAGFWPRKRCRRGRESATQSRGQGAAGSREIWGLGMNRTHLFPPDHHGRHIFCFAGERLTWQCAKERIRWRLVESLFQSMPKSCYILEVGASLESWMLQGQPRAFCKVASFVAWGCCCQLGTRGWRFARWAYWFRTPFVWLLLEWKWSVQRPWVHSSFPAPLQRRTRTLTAPRRKQLGEAVGRAFGPRTDEIGPGRVVFGAWL